MEGLFGGLMSMIIGLVVALITPFVIGAVVVIIHIIALIIYRIKWKGEVLPKRINNYKRIGFFYRIFIMFPRQYVEDRFTMNPDGFPEHGLHMFCGRQGAGKTTAVVEFLLRMQLLYPQIKVRTNMCYKFEDGVINTWKELVKNENGELGQIEVLDEISTWFSSLDSKNFPPEMITEISQQRKQRKMLIGTAQVFQRIAKPIREQTTLVYLPRTFMGCLTFVRVCDPDSWNDEKLTFTKTEKRYFFVHNHKIRNAFDTYHKIERYKTVGFKDEVAQSAMRGGNVEVKVDAV